MLIFALSDKGGTGRSVTSCNLAYRRACQGDDVCYLDFDFGSPTAGAIFEIVTAETGVTRPGLHSFLRGTCAEPARLDVWTQSDRRNLRSGLHNAGTLTLFPGDRGGGEFPLGEHVLGRCTELFLRLQEEFEFCFVDLSAGRSHALDAVLAVTSRPELIGIPTRWMVYHRWTRQHIVAASDLVFGEHGVLKTGVSYGHDAGRLRDAVRFVRTAVVDLNSPELAASPPAQAMWRQDCDRDLQDRARRHQLGKSVVLGHTPMDPVLQWREQLITDTDVTAKQVANAATLESFDRLARRLTEDEAWQSA
jgi:hypothetical protein